MLASSPSPDSSDDHLRRLLDQRAARADPNGLYSTLSQVSDTPSVYSHTFFSPRPSDGSRPDLFSNGHPFKSPTLPPNRRLLDDPTTSMLDLGEDVRSSMAISDVYDRDDQDDSRLENDEDDALARVSYFGPKMRFHSRAPWEMEDEPLQEVDETASQSHFVSMLTGGRGKASFKSSSSSPRPSNAGRPSCESSRSHMNSKRSFETTSSHISHPRGALYALAQESLSTSSLGRPPRSGRQDGLRGKFSLGRLRSHSSTPPSRQSPVNRLPLNDPSSNVPPSPRASYDTTSSALDAHALPGLSPRFAEKRRSLPHPDQGFHPYANPDLVISYSTELPSISPLQSDPQHPGAPRNDSIITVTDNAFPKSTFLPQTPIVPAKKQTSHIQTKIISSPVGVRNSLSNVESPGQQGGIPQQPAPPMSLGTSNIPGWADRPMNPGFSLISLEEARAQRSRIVTTQAPSPLDSASSGESSITTTFLNATQETSTTLASAFDSTQSYNSLRSRTRSISTSAKAKNPFQAFVAPKPERRDSEPTISSGQAVGKDQVNVGGKSLKHKKSGFMRLFGNKNEKDERLAPVPPSPPPPIPSIPDALPRNKLSSHRIPVPSLSPSLLEAVALQDGSDPYLAKETLRVADRSITNLKRTPPTLSINTGHSPTSDSTDPSSHNIKGKFPQSAPPHISDFPTLKLRPVSTLFGAFGNHIVVPELTSDDSDPREKAREKDHQERPQRQNSLTSLFGPPSASAASFSESQSGLSPITSSYTSAATALTTPTTGGLMSPVTPSSWSYGTRFSLEQQSASSYTNAHTTLPSTPFSSGDADAVVMIKKLQERLDSSKKVWQRRVWDLESQVRDLKSEIAELRARCTNDYEEQHCGACGRGKELNADATVRDGGQQHNSSVMNRPRPRTGGLSRFVNTQL